MAEPNATNRPRMTISTITLDSADPPALADFYRRLLGWKVERAESDWVLLRSPEGGMGLAFQPETNYVRPTWPAGPGDQQMMIHLEIEVDDLDAAGAHAVASGAVLAEHQPQDDVRVYLDPAGHPFCLWVKVAMPTSTETAPR